MQTELVEQARRGDGEAFGVLAGRAVDRLYGIARTILRDAELAEDATQEALVRAWRDLPSLRDVERFDAWLYRLVVRACADVGRHRRRWRAEITVLHSEPAETDSASELADRDQLERGLRRLTDAQRTILVTVFGEDGNPSWPPMAAELIDSITFDGITSDDGPVHWQNRDPRRPSHRSRRVSHCCAVSAWSARKRPRSKTGATPRRSNMVAV